MHPMLNVAFSAAREASKIILYYFDRIDLIKTDEKEQNNFVKEVVRQAELTIVTALKKSFPTHAVLGEEGSQLEGDSGFLWVIDALDGTANYIHNIPHFSISIALKHKNQLYLGLIYDPIREELFTTVRGKGVRLNNKRLRVSQVHKLEHAYLATGFPSRSREDYPLFEKIFAHMLIHANGIRRLGSAALDLAYVAAGRFDGFWEFGLKPWDVSAGALMISEAGGLVSDFGGGEKYIETETLVCGNPKIFRALLTVIEPYFRDQFRGLIHENAPLQKSIPKLLQNT